MAAVAEDEFDLYGGEDDIYPQPDPPVSAIPLPRFGARVYDPHISTKFQRTLAPL